MPCGTHYEITDRLFPDGYGEQPFPLKNKSKKAKKGLAISEWICYYTEVVSKTTFPGVAKFGIALEWGSRGLEFESRHSDQKPEQHLLFWFLFSDGDIQANRMQKSGWSSDCNRTGYMYYIIILNQDTYAVTKNSDGEDVIAKKNDSKRYKKRKKMLDNLFQVC